MLVRVPCDYCTADDTRLLFRARDTNYHSRGSSTSLSADTAAWSTSTRDQLRMNSASIILMTSIHVFRVRRLPRSWDLPTRSCGPSALAACQWAGYATWGQVSAAFWAPPDVLGWQVSEINRMTMRGASAANDLEQASSIAPWTKRLFLPSHSMRPPCGTSSNICPALNPRCSIFTRFSGQAGCSGWPFRTLRPLRAGFGDSIGLQ